MALQVAWWCQGEGEGDAAVPLVFASRHGELSRTYEMLRTLARDEPLSPTHFALSTHNAIAAQYGIARRLPANYTAVAAGAAGAEAAFVEALGLLADGADEVLVVVYEASTPAEYAPFKDEADADFAWACRVAAPRGDEPSWSLTVEADADAGDPAPAAEAPPHGLGVLQLLAGYADRLEFRDRGRRWRWQRHV
jgi:hypothetical protein